MKVRVPATIALACAAALVSSACGDSAAGEGDGRLTVVASTSAWASVVRAVAGDEVTVTAVIEDPVADPHSYESTAEDALKFTEADLAVVNGGGYDAFADGLAEQAPDVPVIDAFEASGHESKEHAEDHDNAHEHGGVNEHVWYDLATVAEVADQVAERLGQVAPEQAATLEASAKRFGKGLHTLELELDGIGKAGGKEVLATEPVAHYLLEAAGLRDVTPAEYSNAIEGDTDVPVAAQAEVTRLVEGEKVSAVVHNPQTETDVTGQLVAAAGKAGIPVVQVSETLPEGESDYLAWVGGEVAELNAAVAGS
ncbi:MAG: metal ABC transporter solute-binding protein, Zn/Mn family [Thermocrispum sp.]